MHPSRGWRGSGIQTPGQVGRSLLHWFFPQCGPPSGEPAMYAVFEDGSRQYRVSEGEQVTVDYRDAAVGARVEFNRVLLYQSGDDTRIGQPVLEGFRILADVVDHPSTKTYIRHFRGRKNYRRLKGHRQPYTRLQ